MSQFGGDDFGSDSSMDMGGGGMGGDTGTPPKKDPVRLSRDTLFRLMGGYSTGKDQEDVAANAYPTRYSHNEAVSKIRQHYVRPETNDKLTPQGLITYVQPIHEEIARAKFQSNRFRVLAPEIEQAALILVSSILSPNDLQFTELKFDIKSNKLTSDVKDKISEILAQYFNKTFDIGTKLHDWYKECLFKSGSQPVLILPDVKFEEIKDRPISSTDVSSFATNIGVESHKSLEEQIDNLCRIPVYTDSTYGTERLRTTVEDFFSVKGVEDLRSKDNDKFVDTFITPIMDDVRAITEMDIQQMYPIVKDMPLNDRKLMEIEREKFYSSLAVALEDTTINVITKMNDGDVFRITENPEILRFHQHYSLQRRYNLTQKLDHFWNSESIPYKNEPITPISVESPDDTKKSRMYPAHMVLPPESVIPICIPGDKKQHIGYFIALDQFGHPLVATEEEFDNSMCGNGNAAKAFNTMFGSGGQTGLYRLGDMTKANLISKVFEHILDKYLKAKIDDLDIGDMDISQYNAIIQVMFRRLMFHKKTILVFVPATYITYYAFQHRDDGTGRSKLEDIDFILHLRTTLFVSKIMAMMKDAVDHRVVTIDLDEKVANPEQLIQQVKDLYVAQRGMIFNSNPADIVRTINDASLSVVANNFPGLQNFKVEHSNVSNTTQAPDDNLLDTLNTLFIDFLDVPHSALNQLSENEYSRSIVSNHLFFAKKIIAYQKIANELNDKFVRVYTRYAKPLRDAIAKCINKSGENTEVVPTTTGGDAATISIDEIISHITTKLPTPKVAPDKAQFNEIGDYVQAISGVIDSLVTDEIIPGNDSDAKDAINLYKAYFKVKATEKLAEVIGIDNICDLPNLEDNAVSAQTAISNIYQIAKNLRNHTLAAKSALDRYEDPEQNFQNSGGGDMMGGDMGMDMGGDMGMDMGGGDMGGGDLGMGDMDMSSTSSTSTSTSENGTTETSTSETSMPGINF